MAATRPPWAMALPPGRHQVGGALFGQPRQHAGAHHLDAGVGQGRAGVVGGRRRPHPGYPALLVKPDMVEARAVVQHQGGQGVAVMPLHDFGQIEVGEDIGIYRQEGRILQGSGQGAQAAAGAEDRRFRPDQDREARGVPRF